VNYESGEDTYSLWEPYNMSCIHGLSPNAPYEATNFVADVLLVSKTTEY
jgi:hypothetical protein